MDGWVGGWVGGRVDGWLDGWLVDWNSRIFLRCKTTNIDHLVLSTCEVNCSDPHLTFSIKGAFIS